MEDEIIIYGVKYKRVEKKYPKTFVGDFFNFKVLSPRNIIITDRDGKETHLIDSIPRLKEALKYMEEQ